ncbi:hypothetical protein SAMN04488029_0157 [Reichenbachiella faecimaris]|uniref:Uncharacterized protein n=1 Tax=Reichenbachiella faecimaris TaxID=692418 RepID=A0A1W2G561_REIFA|nr:hypothetical protein [Reichenbachiella faecimaris]SMD31819.1 hypothetical protein SAMN04488029_0157 [Reichenbachiella faecimaris]
MDIKKKYKLNWIIWIMRVCGIIVAALMLIAIWVYIDWIEVSDKKMTMFMLLIIMGIGSFVLTYSVALGFRTLRERTK